MARISFAEAEKVTYPPINSNGYTVINHRAYWYKSFWTTKSEASAALPVARRIGYARIKVLKASKGSTIYAVIGASKK